MTPLVFSPKQRRVLTWWRPGSTDCGHQALICGGAVRSGKTLCAGLSFLCWATLTFQGRRFALCGKTIQSVRRNLWSEVQPVLRALGFSWTERLSRGQITLRLGERENTFLLFGGSDERAAGLIQGVTLAGALLDEAVLMPRSFVNQAMARCSVEGSKLWFNCNPDNPLHWFRQEWILKAPERNALHLHFLMDDNPSLSEEKKAQYRSMFSGVFYQRYILGQWVMGEGLIYDMFDQTQNTYWEMPAAAKHNAQRFIACDYGTTNPCVFLDVYDDGEHIRVDREYRWDSRKERRQKTDQEYADDFMTFMGDDWCTVLVDPSAASFITALRQRGVYVREADNTVLDGIRRTGALFAQRVLLISEINCMGLIGELGSYMWDDKAAQRGEEKPVKQQDHGPDALRYFVNDLPDWRFEGVQTT